VAFKAAKTVFEGGKWLGTTQCHGLAGNIEFLLDLFQITKNIEILNAAYNMGSLLETYKISEGQNYKWPSEDPDIFTPDYMVGYAGVGACFLRLANPHLPYSISRKAFHKIEIESR
jgi:lantibiotic modifying enzyme